METNEKGQNSCKSVYIIESIEYHDYNSSMFSNIYSIFDKNKLIYIYKALVMTAQEAWKTIMNRLGQERREFHTVPLLNKAHVWFSATVDEERIVITEATENKPSSSLTIPRYLKYKTFEKVYPIYLRREKGEKVSKEVTEITVNSVYYYSLIRFLIGNQ